MLAVVKCTFSLCYTMFLFQRVWMLKVNQNGSGVDEAQQQNNCTGTSNESEACRAHANENLHTATTTSVPTPRAVESFNGECTNDETIVTRCVVGQGVCYVVIIDHQRKVQCHCNKRYTGHRCEELNFSILFDETRAGVATAGIAASVGGVVVVMLILTGVFLFYRRRRRNRRKQRPRTVNGNTGIQENTSEREVLQQSPIDTKSNSNGHSLHAEGMELIAECKTTDV